MKLSEASAVPELVQNLIISNESWFEQAALSVILQNRDLLKKLTGVLCHNPRTQEFLGDFTDVALNAVYALHVTYVQALGFDAPEPDEATLSKIVTFMVHQGNQIVPGEEDMVVRTFMELYRADCKGKIGVVGQGLFYWMQLKRLAYVNEEYGGTQDASSYSETIREFSAPLQVVEEVDYDFQFGHGVRENILDVKRIPTGIALLDRALGGGVGYTEYMLAMTVQGGGKTVLACQLATAMARNGACGVLITTEQPHEQLEPRIIACHANIPFEKIKDKVDLLMLTAEELRAYETLEAELDGRFRIIDWNRKQSQTVVADLKDEILRMQDKMGRKLDYLVLDWLGGNLGAQGLTPEMRRTLMKDASDALGTLALDLNMATIAFAQANMKQAANKKAISAEHISENKQLGEKAATVLGISSLISTGDVDGAPTFAEQQYFYLSKSRKTLGGFVPIKRDFGYQRFKA